MSSFDKVVNLGVHLPVAHLSSEDISQLEIALAFDGSVLSCDILDVASCANFDQYEVRYLKTKDKPVQCFLEMWREEKFGKNATLQKLSEILRDIKRLDACEIVDKRILALQHAAANTHARGVSSNAGPSWSHGPLTERLNRTTAGLSELKIMNSAKLSFDNGNRSSSSEGELFTLICYCADTDNHFKNVAKFAKTLRKSGFRATADFFESGASSDAADYLCNRISHAEFVLIICSPLFKKALDYPGDSTSSCSQEQKVLLAGESQKVKFIMRFVLDYKFASGGRNDKFIPVLLPGCQTTDVPSALRNTTCYTMKKEYNDLKRRLSRVERIQAPPVQKKRTLVPMRIDTKIIRKLDMFGENGT